MDLGGVYGACIGRMAEATAHGSVDNDWRWCMNSHGESEWHINYDDCVSFVLLLAGACKNAGKHLPEFLIENIRGMGR